LRFSMLFPHHSVSRTNATAVIIQGIACMATLCSVQGSPRL
jgi:hypothetical protein